MSNHHANASSNVFVQRLVAVGALCVAFLIMASLFDPDDSHAEHHAADPHHAASQHDADTDHHHHHSTDPHEGLVSLGHIESASYLLSIFQTDVGPRYSVSDLESGELLATLRTREQIEQEFPGMAIDSMSLAERTATAIVTSSGGDF